MKKTSLMVLGLAVVLVTVASHAEAKGGGFGGGRSFGGGFSSSRSTSSWSRPSTPSAPSRSWFSSSPKPTPKPIAPAYVAPKPVTPPPAPPKMVYKPAPVVPTKPLITQVPKAPIAKAPVKPVTIAKAPEVKPIIPVTPKKPMFYRKPTAVAAAPIHTPAPTVIHHYESAPAASSGGLFTGQNMLNAFLLYEVLKPGETHAATQPAPTQPYAPPAGYALVPQAEVMPQSGVVAAMPASGVAATSSVTAAPTLATQPKTVPVVQTPAADTFTATQW